ncbi:YSIRK-type signal peptide-containing protein [Staphylococcus arlettae]|uniref:YSIRK-type signal peptide-containing protein n=5 Tax=Staphylococcus arlettae TaxID=29378 RepID=UPI002DB63FF7|nr:YSIRK-type signal peptide-containing protein [Staphylococcus arlettae]MEB7421222.1 YSIRK-type signal peptide-containing protein [Staphylococcus arlettae]
MKTYKEHTARKHNKYAIRKFSVGLASIMVGSIIFFGHYMTAQASEVQNNEDSNQSSLQANNVTEVDVVSETGELKPNVQRSSNSATVGTQDNLAEPNNAIHNITEGTNSVTENRNQQQQSVQETPNKADNTTKQGEAQNQVSNQLSQVRKANFQEIPRNIPQQNNNVQHSAPQVVANHSTPEYQSLDAKKVKRQVINKSTYDVDVLKIIEKNKQHLNEEERKFFLRMASRNTSFLPNDWSLIYNRNYKDISRNVFERKIGKAGKEKNEKVLTAMYDLIEQRNNNEFHTELSKDHKRYIKKHKYNLKQNINAQNPTIDIRLSKDIIAISQPNSVARFESWGLRLNENLANKIEEVKVNYNWNNKSIEKVINKDSNGFYWVRGDVDLPVKYHRAGGGMDFALKLRQGQFIDKINDKLWGYIIADSNQKATIVGSTLSFKKFDFAERNYDINFNEKLLTLQKNRLIRKINDNTENFINKDSLKQKYLQQVNHAIGNITTVKEFAQVHHTLEQINTSVERAAKELKTSTINSLDVNAQTKFVDVFKYIDAHKDKLTSEEHQFLLRMVSRFGTFLERDWNLMYQARYNEISNNVNTRVLGNQVNQINKILTNMRELIQSRNGENYFKDFSSDSQNKYRVNNYSVDSNITKDDMNRQQIVLGINKGQVTSLVSLYKKRINRFENWGLRTNEALNAKLASVKVRYRWANQDYERELVRSKEGVYWFDERQYHDDNKYHSGGGVKFVVTFKKGHILDHENDMAWGYVISDSKNKITDVGANIGFGKYDFRSNQLDATFNNNAVQIMKEDLQNYITKHQGTLLDKGGDVNHFTESLNAINTNGSNTEVIAQLSQLGRAINTAINKSVNQSNVIVIPTNKQHIGTYAKGLKDVYFISAQSLNTNPINSLNPDGSLDIQPKGYFFYKVKATDKLATGNKFNLQIKTKSVAEQTRFEYAFIGADNKYISKNLMIPKVEDGLYQLNNILVPKGTNAIMLRLDNRNGNSDVAIQNISLIAHEALTNEASRNNLIVVPPSQQHIANFAKSIKDSYFSSYQAKNSSPNNSFDKDGSLTIAPSGYFFYNLNTINDLAPGKQFKIQVITAHNADKSKVEYRFTKGENNEKLPIISVQKDAQSNFVSDNITVPENAKTLALRIDNRQGSEEFKILGVNVFPVQV